MKVTNSSRLGKGLKKGICLGKGGIKKSKGNLQNSNSSILLDRCQYSNLRVVKFWHEHSVFTLGSVGYKFGLSLGW